MLQAHVLRLSWPASIAPCLHHPMATQDVVVVLLDVSPPMHAFLDAAGRALSGYVETRVRAARGGTPATRMSDALHPLGQAAGRDAFTKGGRTRGGGVARAPWRPFFGS